MMKADSMTETLQFRDFKLRSWGANDHSNPTTSILWSAATTSRMNRSKSLSPVIKVTPFGVRAAARVVAWVEKRANLCSEQRRTSRVPIPAMRLL